jgi:aspartate carbamoyltransferase catalytic subunit
MAQADSKARHLLGIDSLTDAEVRVLLDRAQALSGGARPARLERIAANLFFEPSTRTRVSFELAAGRLGMTVINIELNRSSSAKGESLEDTVATLTAMGVECLVLRHPETSRCERLVPSLTGKISLLNGGDGSGEHPSQALLDAATLEAAGINWPEATIAIVGDIRHSRVARSGMKLFKRLGLGCLRIAGPEQLMPAGRVDGVEICTTLEEAVRDADAVMMLRVQRERMDAAGWPDQNLYHQDWGLREEHLRLAAPDCRVLHPGPINRGMEIDDLVADGPHSLILDQVRMGVFTRMAIFEWLFGDRRLPD